MDTHWKNGYLYLDELCRCGGEIKNSGCKETRMLGVVVVSETWICEKCGKEKKDLRETKIFPTGSKYGI